MTFHEWDRKTSAFSIGLLRAASVFFIALTRVLFTIIRLFHSTTTLVVLYKSISFLKSVPSFLIQVGSLSKMSVKRSRLGESSSFVEKDLLNHMSFTVESAREVGSAAPSLGERKPPKCLKPSVDEGTKEQPRQNVILKSPARASKSGGLGDFLKNCNFCTKKIKQDEDVFMYRDYCAYCSEKCRGYQIELDEMVQKQLADSRAAAQDQEMNNLMSRFY